MMFFRITLLVLFTMLVTACSTQPQIQTPPPTSVNTIKEWSAEGRVGIRTKDDAVSGNFDWHHTSNTFDLRIYGPFGQGSTKLSKNKSGKVTLSYKGKVIEGNNASQLLSEQLGWKFPVQQVGYWIKGLPYPNTPSKITKQFNSALPSQIVQDGWTIEYENFADVRGLKLPQKMQVSKSPYRVNLIITQWTIQ